MSSSSKVIDLERDQAHRVRGQGHHAGLSEGPGHRTDRGKGDRLSALLLEVAPLGGPGNNQKVGRR